MASFVDLMASVVWSDADIVNRTEAMVRSEFSAEAEAILNRAVSGSLSGSYQMSAEEQATVARFQSLVLAARDAGKAARADMALLRDVLGVEQAQRRIDQQPLALEFDLDGNVLNQPALDADAAERAAAQQIVNGATQAARDLVAMRRAHAASS